MPTCDSAGLAVSSQLTGLGAVADLEARIAAHFGMRFAVAMPSATTGLLTLGLTLDLQSADFITTPLTYGGSIAAWLTLGATPTFADVDRNSLTVSPQAVARLVTNRTRAILGVDLCGYPCDDEALRREADRCGAWLVIDAAQSLGATRRGRASGAVADAVVVSFTAGKTLDVGEGGAVVTNHRELYERLIWHSQHPYRQKRELGLHRVNELAINGRIHPLAARRALRQFDRSLAIGDRRREWAEAVTRALAAVPGVDLPTVETDVQPSYHRLTVRGRGKSGRHSALAALARGGIQASASDIPVSLLTRHPAFQRNARQRSTSHPVAERELATRICLWPAPVSFSHSQTGLDAAMGRS